MGIFRSLAGMITLELTSADISAALSAINSQGIPIFDVRRIGDLSAVLDVRRGDFRKLLKLTQRRGDIVKVRKREGLYWSLKTLLCRPVLSGGLALLLILALVLPGRILFIRVEGNEKVPTNLILEAAQESGIRFGASRREVRSEKVKNALLSAVPELQWAGVNTYGSVAVISVREREITEEPEERAGVSSIVADRDGVILSVTVTNGSGVCSAGQAVTAGDVLISGYTDCGLCVTATRAEGEIRACTRRALTVRTPAEHEKRGEQGRTSTNYGLILGKKRINFYKGSGISDASCVKMYTEYCLTLPGGFRLPVTLVKETVTEYAFSAAALSEEEAFARMAEFASEYLYGQMVAGSITDRIESVIADRGGWELAGEYACTEMIGREQTEEIGVIP